MRNVFLALLTACSLALAASACGKDANTQMCLDDNAKLKDLVAKKDNGARSVAGDVYQSCGISCDVTKDADACAAFKDVTKMLCEKEGQDACKELCEGNNGKKNEHACALVK
jgi:hypothetical protein